MALAHLRANKVSEGLGIYAVGFLDGAVALFARANAGHGLVDCAIYPAAYCLRHGIELFVKQISVYVAYELRDPKLLYEPGHSLVNAWKSVVESVDWYASQDFTCDGDEHRHDVDVINSVIDDLEELDTRGTLFRYPEFVEKAKANRPRTREDTHVPFDDVNLDDWTAIAQAALGAVQSLLGEWGTRAGDLRSLRGDPPGPLSDLVKPRTG